MASTRDSLPWYVVLSIQKDHAVEPSGHSHVLGLATRDPDGGEAHWTLVQVISAIRDGERFVVGEDPNDQGAAIEPTRPCWNGPVGGASGPPSMPQPTQGAS